MFQMFLFQDSLFRPDGLFRSPNADRRLHAVREEISRDEALLLTIEARVAQLRVKIKSRNGVGVACAEVGSILAQIAHVGDELAPCAQTELPIGGSGDMRESFPDEFGGENPDEFEPGELEKTNKPKGSPRAKK